jgi:hypothetical protein
MVGMTKQEMSYWARVLVPAVIFCGIGIALNHSSDPRIQRFMTQYWFSYRGHWYSPFLLTQLLLIFAAAIYGRRHHRRQLKEALAGIDAMASKAS